MKNVWRLFAWKLGRAIDIFESEDPRAIARLGERVYALSVPEDHRRPDSVTFTLEWCADIADPSRRAVTTWQVIPGAVPAGCRKPRGCAMVNGQAVDIARMVPPSSSVILHSTGVE